MPFRANSSRKTPLVLSARVTLQLEMPLQNPSSTTKALSDPSMPTLKRCMAAISLSPFPPKLAPSTMQDVIQLQRFHSDFTPPPPWTPLSPCKPVCAPARRSVPPTPDQHWQHVTQDRITAATAKWPRGPGEPGAPHRQRAQGNRFLRTAANSAGLEPTARGWRRRK